MTIRTGNGRPSPWRLLGAVTARWHQRAREMGKDPERPEHLADLERLQAALCNSAYAFHLPPSARRGIPLRQYHPTTFGWNPAGKKKPGTRGYGTSLVQDNYWCVPPDEPVWWLIEGDAWNDDVVAALGACVERLTWFGRAETLTRVRVALPEDRIPEPNCSLHDDRIAGTAPVLVPLPNATRQDVERTTDDDKAKQRSVPPGAVWRYALRPSQPPVRERRRAPAYQESLHLVRLAIGWNVAPEPRARSDGGRSVRSPISILGSCGLWDGSSPTSASHEHCGTRRVFFGSWNFPGAQVSYSQPSPSGARQMPLRTVCTLTAEPGGA